MKQFVPQLLAAALLASAASADLITGRVVDSLGNGIPNVDLDAKNLGGGGDPTLLNDGTDANGFFATTIPAGTYRITFNPPPPPTSTSLFLEIEPVVVSGTTALGNVALPAGVGITGTVIGPGGTPVSDVNMDVIVLATGVNIDLINDTTSPTGAIAMSVPAGAIELRFDTTPVVGPVLAPTFMTLDLSSSVSLGTVALETGYTVSALLRRPGGLALSNTDVDVTNAFTDEGLYTPGDDSDASGFVDFVVPAGTFDIQTCPTFANHLVSIEVNRTVTANTSLGILTHVTGQVLNGTVRSIGGTPIGGVDVDVDVSSTGVQVPLCGDDTAANGVYSVIVPAGTFDVSFDPSYSVPYAGQTVPSVVVSGTTSRNGTLPDCPFSDVIGNGNPGTGGLVPQISAVGGTPRLGNDGYTVRISQARGGASALLLVGLSVQTLPFGSTGGPYQRVHRLWIHQGPGVVTLGGAAGVAGAGTFDFSFPLDAAGLVSGQELRAQALIYDAGGRSGIARTPVLSAFLCP